MNARNDKADPEFLLSRYLDGDLDAAEQAELELRLREDASLREELRLYTALNERLEAADDAELGGIDYDAERAAIIGRLERKMLLEGPPRRRLTVRLGGGVLVAAAVLLIVASVALRFFWPAPPQKTSGEVSVSLVPPGRILPASPAMVSAGPVRPHEGETIRPGPALASGAVMVSVGSRGEISNDEPFPTVWFGIE